MAEAQQQYFYYQHAGSLYYPSSFPSAGYEKTHTYGVQVVRQLPNSAPKKSDEAQGVLVLKVPFICQKCVDRVQEKLTYFEGVESVVCVLNENKVTVTGRVKADKILKEVRKIKNFQGAEFWPKKGNK